MICDPRLMSLSEAGTGDDNDEGGED